jgi:hypothetical protein
MPSSSSSSSSSLARRPWREELQKTREQVDRISREIKELDVSQRNQFEEFVVKNKNEEWVEKYHKKLVSNDIALREMETGIPTLLARVAEVERSVYEKRQRTIKSLEQHERSQHHIADAAEAEDFWSSIPSGVQL